MPISPQCKHCQGETRPPIRTKGGLLSYRCKTCGKYTTPEAKWGGHNKIDDGLTPQQRWEARHEIKERRNQKRRESRAKSRDLGKTDGSELP
jgi:tRNA(Ile2) C34 agmatinyltransferase TiaS